MVRVRVTKIICGCCEGTGKSPAATLHSCGWCGGRGRQLVSEALRYSYALESLAVGGYINGDHDLVDKAKMMAKVSCIRRLAEHGHV